MKKRIFATLLVLLLLLCACGAEEPWQAAYRRTGQALAAQEDYGVGSIGGEWAVIGLSRSGLLKQETAQAYLQTVEDYVRSIGTARLDHAKSTENSRIILGVTAAGGDVTDIGGVNLLEGLTDMAFVSYQGLNGPIWALIALDCGGYEIPDAQPGEEQTTREALIRLLLRERKADGGWCFSGDASDADMTAMALTALAPYRERGEVAEAIEGALQCLSEMQLENGCFASWGSENSESCAQVIVALTALGIDPMTDGRFIKNGLTALDALASFYVSGGGFRHTADGALDGMATEQGYYALAAYYRFAAGQTNLFNMSDVTIQANTPATPDQPGTPANPDNPGTAKPTGDTILLWAILAPAAFLAAAALIRKKKQA